MIKRGLRSLYFRYREFFFQRKHRGLSFNYRYLFLNNVIDCGRGNKVIAENDSAIANCKIVFRGNDCTLIVGSNCSIDKATFWFEDDGGEIKIGDFTSMEEGCQFSSVGGRRIQIGEDCMFSHTVDVRTSDSHSVLDSLGNRINIDEDILIGNHVWLGIRSTILKGAKISDESIVAACALVAGSQNIPQGCILAGVPARVVKENVSWLRKRI